MTASEIDNQGFIPIVAGIKNGRTTIALRKKYCSYKYVTWNHGDDNFVPPVILGEYQKKLLREVLN